MDKKAGNPFETLYGIPANINLTESITGQIMFRKATDIAPDGSGRKMMMVFGVVAIPEEAPIEEHEQYTVLGELENNLFQDLQLQIGLNDSVKPNEQITIGNSIAGILKSPIWRV